MLQPMIYLHSLCTRRAEAVFFRRAVAFLTCSKRLRLVWPPGQRSMRGSLVVLSLAGLARAFALHRRGDLQHRIPFNAILEIRRPRRAGDAEIFPVGESGPHFDPGILKGVVFRETLKAFHVEARAQKEVLLV